MKRNMLIVDIIFIIVTVMFLVYSNTKQSTGLAALEDTGMFVIGLLSLGIEIIILILLVLTREYQKAKKRDR